MKTFKHISLIAALLLAAFAVQNASAGNYPGRKKDEQQNMITIKGKVVEIRNGALLFLLQSLLWKQT